ncbi:MAG TPA: hypothetical protein VN934_10950 [Candidatus Tumulicola sp.]|nr:hypothetical protein [Candidatus Tumulicola sp.]
MIGRDSTLVDVCFAICTELGARALKVVLTGGSAATFYAPQSYQSYDADFVAVFAVDEESQRQLVAAMSDLGYDLDGRRIFQNRNGNPFAVEFPKGPLAVGGDYIQRYDTVRRGEEMLNVITATDSVRDRLAAYYSWDDRSSLQTAVSVCLAVPEKVDLTNVEGWSRREGQLDKHAEFVRLLSPR